MADISIAYTDTYGIHASFRLIGTFVMFSEAQEETEARKFQFLRDSSYPRSSGSVVAVHYTTSYCSCS